MYRTKTCGELRISNVGETVTLAGWVQSVHNLGALTFVDLRDRYGITQLAFNEDAAEDLRQKAGKLGREFVIQATGVVAERYSKNKNIPTGDIEASLISVGDYVNNIAFNNQKGECERYNLIPGVTRIINKVFVNVDARNEFYYLGKRYHINTNQDPNKGEVGVNLIKTNGGKQGFYLFTALDPVYINHYNQITRQYSLANDVISHSLKFIPMKGLHISAKHRPGFDEYGRVNIDAGITKIYSMLADDSIKRGLCNPNMVDYRYIVDSMSYGLDSELGGKVYLSQLARDRMKTTALLNLPSKRQFELSEDPCFCDTYEKTIYSKPPFNTKYIPMGGNSDLYNTKTFSLPSEENGSKFTAAFWPHLTYNSFGRRVSVPPAADVCDVLIRKFQGGDPYVISANRNGII